MKSWSQRELALAVLVVFAAPAIPYVTSRLLGDLSSLFLGTPNKALLAKRILLCSLFAGKETG